LAYFLAVTQRSSLGVATLIASERFHTNAQQLASLAVFQLVIYAAMQIPVGILLDRFGAKRLLAVGALIMAIGQMTVALSPNLLTAVIGRMLVGMGDAFTFISMIRMVNGWYKGAKASKVQQYISSGGQLGQFFSAVPFWWMLEHLGWNLGFSIMATASLITVFLVIAFTSDDSDPTQQKHRAENISVAIKQLKENIKNPGIRMSFWTHYVTQPTTTAIQLLWAVPFLVTAQGQSHDFASLTLTSMVFLGFITGPVIGSWCARYSQHRAKIVYSVVGMIFLTWIVIISQPGPMPAPFLYGAFLVISIGGPASMIAFDFSKDMVPASKLGTANGFANVGGFLATFLMMYLTGLVIDLVHLSSGGPERYTIDAFRLGFASQLLIVAIGVAGFTIERRKYRKLLAENGNS
jgi:MFS family permease